MPRLTETERARHFLLLREKLGIDKPLVLANTRENLDKSEKEACNLVARARGEGRAIVRPAGREGRDPYEPWEMTPREREVATKFVRLIQYHPTANRHQQDQETPSDPDRLLANTVENSSQHE